MLCQCPFVKGSKKSPTPSTWWPGFLGGDADKTGTWFKTRNPLLGDISPRDMICLGRFQRLRKFIWLAMSDKVSLH
jgi:hypothetical protein